MSKKNENLKVWNQVCTTDPDMTEKISFGALRFTTVDAQSQIMKATEIFGPCGIGWKVVNQNFQIVSPNPANHEDNLLVFTAEFHYVLDGVSGNFDIVSDIPLYNKTKNGTKFEKDPYKKVRTDAVTKALSWLGFNADVFLGMFDDNKYIEDLQNQKAMAQKKEAKLKESGYSLPSAEQLEKIQELAKAIDLKGTAFATYLREKFNTSWSMIHAGNADQIIADLMDSKAKPETKSVTQAVQDPDAPEPESDTEPESPKEVEAPEPIQTPEPEKSAKPEPAKRAVIAPRTVNEYYADLTPEQNAECNAHKDLDKKVLLTHTARETINRIYRAADNKDEAQSKLVKTIKDITGKPTLGNRAPDLFGTSVKRLETLVKTLANME